MTQELNHNLEQAKADYSWLDESVFYLDADRFNAILDWMEAPATESQIEAMKRISRAKLWA